MATKKKEIKGKTKSGFEYKLLEARLNDFELIEEFAELDNNPLLLPRILERLLGKEQKANLYEHVRDEDGIVPIDLITDEMMEIFTSETKN